MSDRDFGPMRAHSRKPACPHLPKCCRLGRPRRARIVSHGRGRRMKNFLRGLRFTWPYRGRLCISVVCALFAAILWGINLSAVFPVLRLLENPKTWAEQLDDDVRQLQKEEADLQ